MLGKSAGGMVQAGGFKAPAATCTHTRLQLFYLHRFEPPAPPRHADSASSSPQHLHLPPSALHCSTTPLGRPLTYPLTRWWPYCWRTARFLAATRGGIGRTLRRWCRRWVSRRWHCGSNSALWTGTAPVLPCPRSAAFGTTREAGRGEKNNHF